MHFRRPSSLCETERQVAFENLSTADAPVTDLDVLRLLRDIMQYLTVSANLSEDVLESLIPQPMQIYSTTSDMSLNSARLYLALHPLFTRSELFGGGMHDTSSSRLFYIIAGSASRIIDHFAELDEDNQIISIFMAAEQVFEAGLVWAASLPTRYKNVAVGHQLTATEISSEMAPIMKVSSLLASFAARWKHGTVYVTAWKIFTELLWNML